MQIVSIENKFSKKTNLTMLLSALPRQSKFCVEKVAGILFYCYQFSLILTMWFSLIIYVLGLMEKVAITGIFEIIYSFQSSWKLTKSFP